MAKKSDSQLDAPLSRGIVAVILLIMAILIILSFFNSAGTLGVVLNEWILSFLFGKIRFVVPFFILIIAWYHIREQDAEYHPTHIIGGILFFFTIASLFHLSFEPPQMWPEALNGNGGGLSGMLAWPLKTYVGIIGSIVILIGLFLVSIFLLFNHTVHHFINFYNKLGNSFGSRQGTKAKDVQIYENGDDKNRKFFAKKIEEEEEDEEDDDEDYEDDEEEEYEEEEDEEYEDEEDDQPTPDELPHVHMPGAEPTHAVNIWEQDIIVKELPKLSLLSNKRGKAASGDIKGNAKIIHETFKQFKINVAMNDVRVGPTVTQYSLKPARGVKVSRITSLSNDLALALAAHPIRIEAPIPGKSLVGIEVPNEKNAMVTLRELLEQTPKHKEHKLMMALGKDVAGKVWFADLPRMPHLLIAGATGSGKTVCMHTIILSLLFQNTPKDLRMIMVDPKRVELSLYNGIPHLVAPVITNTKKTINALKWAISEMERRFDLLAAAKCRDITSYNKKHPSKKIPRIVFFIDELADLMATAANDVEAGIIRIAQLARAVGIHLVLATQRPSVDVITGLMKANIPARIAFSVASLTDSRTILDAQGAEKLMGRGDMLHLTAELGKPVRIQGAFVADEEVKKVVDYLKDDSNPPTYNEELFDQSGGTKGMFGGADDDKDALYNDAKALVVQAKKASTSLIQRKLKVGYARAARIMDELEESGIIGPSNGSKPREVLITAADLAAPPSGKQNVYKKTPPPPPVEEDESEEIEDDDEEYEEEEEEYEENTEEFEDTEEDDFEEEEYEDEEDENDEDEKDSKFFH